MTDLMKEYSSESQAPFMTILNQLGAADKATSFFVANVIFIRDVDLPLINALSTVSGDFTVREPFIVKLEAPVLPDSAGNSSSTSSVQWGVGKIEADVVWERDGVTGNGVIVATIDTGVYKDHESLRDNYGGGWLDAVNGEPEPYDDNGHGTHTLGTICGTTGGIGVAPGASWIACKGLDERGFGTEENLLRCAQWLFTRRPLPQLVSNSWGGPSGATFFNEAISAWRSVGIIPVFAIGNSGPHCDTADSPGDQPGVLSVGATDMMDKITEFSSRGQGSNSERIKPEVSAPGIHILSASYTGAEDYVKHSGTSMAAPHVAGAIALMLESDPSLEFEGILWRLEESADRPELSDSDLECRDGSNHWPNNEYGYGRINVRRVFEA
jgi:subtilisin family serine protease